MAVDIFKILESVLPLIAGGVSAVQDRNTGRAIESFANNPLLDPFGQTNRALYQQKLRDLYSDPSTLESTPGFTFARDQGEKAINRANAARGSFYSTNALHDLANFNQGLASRTYNTEADRLARLSGSQFGPDAKLAMDALSQGRGLQDNALGQVFAGLGRAGIGGGAGGAAGGGLGDILRAASGVAGGLGLGGASGGGGGVLGAIGDLFGLGGDDEEELLGGDIFGGNFGLGSLGGIAGPASSAITSILSSANFPAAAAATGPELFYGSSGLFGGAGSGASAFGSLAPYLGGAGLAAIAAPTIMSIFDKITGPSGRDVWDDFYNQATQLSGGPVAIPSGQPGAGEQGIPFNVGGRTVYIDPAINQPLWNTIAPEDFETVNQAPVPTGDAIWDAINSLPGAGAGDYARIVGTNEAVAPRKRGGTQIIPLSHTAAGGAIRQNAVDAQELGATSFADLARLRQEVRAK